MANGDEQTAATSDEHTTANGDEQTKGSVPTWHRVFPLPRPPQAPAMTPHFPTSSRLFTGLRNPTGLAAKERYDTLLDLSNRS